jgi:hypothetical protein
MLGAGLARLLGGFIIGLTEGQSSYVLPVIGREIFSWQLIFLFVALPTIPLSILLMTIREPERRGTRREIAAGSSATSWADTMAYIRLNLRTVVCHSFGFALLSFSGYGSGAWNPSHFHRNFDLPLSQVGFITGMIQLFGGSFGVLLGGYLADTLYKRGVRASKTTVGLVACLAWFPFGIAYPLFDNLYLAIGSLALANTIAAMPWGVGPAGIQEIFPNRMRGQASAVYLFIINLCGIGLGPYIPSLLTQFVFKSDQGVRYSLLVVPTTAHLIAGLLLFLAIKPFARSLDRLEEWRRREDSDGA